MTKDEQIAWLMGQVELLQKELAAERTRRPLTGAERQRRYVTKRDEERHSASLGGTIGGEYVPTVPVEDLEPVDLKTLSVVNDAEMTQNVTDRHSDAFELAWKAYPSRRGKKLHKGSARTSFKANVGVTQFELVMVAIGNYISSDEVQRGIVMDMHRWLPDWQQWETPEERKPRPNLRVLDQATQREIFGELA